MAAVEFERPLVDIEVEVEPHLEQQASLDDSRGDVGGADGAEVDGVELAPLAEDRVGQDHSVVEVALTTEVVVDGVELDTGCGDDPQALTDDLWADSVAADDCDLVLAHAAAPSSGVLMPTGRANNATRHDKVRAYRSSHHEILPKQPVQDGSHDSNRN